MPSFGLCGRCGTENGKRQPFRNEEMIHVITLEGDRLEIRFPEVHDNASFGIEFQRTLRIPDDDTDYPLPPGLGGFPLRHLDDYAARLPEEWHKRGGVIAPMHQSEAMWINFQSRHNYRLNRPYPFAVKIATGKICAITGETWVNHLNTDPQDYVVLPEQPWLDGYCIEKGTVRQFVAMPLGEGYTVEEQLTGAAEHGGLQIVAYPMKAERYEELIAGRTHPMRSVSLPPCNALSLSNMGLAPGGRMKQEIYDDYNGLDAWDQRHVNRCFVTIVNSAQWMAVTGEQPPTGPPTATEYTEAGLPWFDYYGGDVEAISGAEKLSGIKSVAQIAGEKGDELAGNETVEVRNVVKVRGRRANQVREFSEN